MSLNEFFVALICCCKGTVGEKALALFHMHSYHAPRHQLNHIIPVLHHSKAIVEKVEGNQEREKGATFAPPNDEDVPKETALHFKIYTHTQGDNMLLGEVFVPNLHPYLWVGMGKDAPSPFTIWGTKMRLPPGVQQTQAMKQDPSKIRPFVGEMNLGIKWMPGADDSKPEVGQIGIHVHSIRFDSNRVEAPKWKNPWIEVLTYDENFHPIHIKRWDPRNSLRKAGNVMTAGLAYSGAYKDNIEFGETMRRDALGHLHSRWGQSGHGWDAKTGLWQWNEKWGDQYSEEGFAFRKDLVGIASAQKKPNTITLQACRLITLAILRRGMNFIANREALLVADSAFSRAGVVPGIIDAVLIQGSEVSHDYATPTDLKAAYDKMASTTIVASTSSSSSLRSSATNIWVT
jgi:hypothetical protein